MRKQIKIRVKADLEIKFVAEELDNNRGVITVDGKLYRRNEFQYVERVWCHFCRNNDEVAFVDTFFGIRACCKNCKPINCCMIPGCTHSIYSTHKRNGKLYAFCYIHFRKSKFFDPEEDAYDGISDEGVIASEKLWVEISNRRKFSKAEIAEYEQLLESYRIYPARW